MQDELVAKLVELLDLELLSDGPLTLAVPFVATGKQLLRECGGAFPDGVREPWRAVLSAAREGDRKQFSEAAPLLKIALDTDGVFVTNVPLEESVQSETQAAAGE